jgi:hypothetical protein
MLRRALSMLRRALSMLRRAPLLQVIDLKRENPPFFASTFLLPAAPCGKLVEQSETTAI